ncbi:uncharacterized protein K02A2.6-like [Saccostrea cucullata]|uniref:uncharacterized protein K02A2.6-like n=1 Tax=Saccostrea cuccullata TaxID=36930 RepID=UPI002ED15B94
MYLYGIDFELLTDHKPLEYIYSAKSKPSARISRWVLRLQPYRFKVVYIKGKDNIADPLSRLTQVNERKVEQTDTDDFMKLITLHSIPKAMSIKQIETESASDQVLKSVRNSIRKRTWPKGENKAYMIVKNELSVIGKLVRRGIVMPQTLQNTTLKIAHEGHPGIMVMKRHLRTKVWWPGMDRDAEDVCKRCHACQVVSQKSNPEPVKSTGLPKEPWQLIGADLMGPLPSEDSLFVVVDYHSRYVEVEIMRKTTTDRIIRNLHRMFQTHGLPLQIVTDNGSQFIGGEFKDFMEQQNIEHRRVTLLLPQANGEVEIQNRSILKRLKIAQVEKRNWRDELSDYLTMYRTTPHSSTGVSPLELLFKRKIRTRLPTLDTTFYDPDDMDQETRDRDAEKKGTAKSHADEKYHAKESDLGKGDKVLPKQPIEDTLSSNFELEPYEVLSKNGNSCSAEKRRKL